MEDDNRQEWIFTLYDFDNSGKVTKDVSVHPFSLLSVLPDVPCLLNIDSLLLLLLFSRLQTVLIVFYVSL